jgi:hypothetical protein
MISLSAAENGLFAAIAFRAFEQWEKDTQECQGCEEENPSHKEGHPETGGA